MKALSILLLGILLASCQIFAPAPAPVRVDLSGATGLYLQGGGASHTLARSVVAPSGATLMKLTSSTATEAVFEDASGNPVSVSVLRTLQLDADYLLMEYNDGTGSAVAIVTLATGELRAPDPAPDNWERIRVRAGTAYYVADGHLTRLSLATMAAVDMSQGDIISSQSLVFLDAQSNAHTLYLLNGMIDQRNQVRIYYADGSPFDTLGWGNTSAYTLCFWYGVSIFEDEATGTATAIWAQSSGTSQGLWATPYTFDATGVYEGTAVQLDPAPHGFERTITPQAGKAFLGNVAFAEGDSVVTVSVSAGVVTASTTRALATYGQPTVYQGGIVYTASPTGIDTMDMASGAAAQIITEPGITALDVVAGSVFYATATGVYQRDSAGVVTLYSSDPVDIEAITE